MIVKLRQWKLLKELARVETASVNGNLVNIAKDLGPVVDLRIYCWFRSRHQSYNALVGQTRQGQDAVGILRQIFKGA